MSKNVIHASGRFARSPLRDIHTRAMMAIGDIGKRQTTDEAAYTYGKRRAIGAALALTAGLTLNSVTESGKGAAKHDATVETCASTIVGHAVQIGHDSLGDPIVPAADFEAVNACEITDGDVKQAQEQIERHKPTPASP